MKATILSIAFVITGMASYASPSKYEQAMRENINALNEAQSPEQFQEVINKLDRIANKETDKWEPLYYMGFGYLMIALRTEDGAGKDKYLDLALENIKNGMALAPEESELLALEGFVHMIRVTVDPATRGQQYAGLSMQAFGKALALNPDNPRALYLMGQMELGTAKFFGSDTSAACAKLTSSIEKFDTYHSDNPLAPTWGKKSAENAAAACQTGK